MAQVAIQEAIGNAQQAFADSAKAKREELMETGQCEPFTIVNFNPVPLNLEGELQRYRVPSPMDERLPKDVLRIKIPYDGRERVGHLLTIREPHIYGKNVNATWHPGGGPGDAVVSREVMYYTPMAVAYNFLEHFSPIFVAGSDGKVAPPPKDARKIFGVLAFKGDIHTLENLLNEEDDSRRIINVPLATLRTSGKIISRSYKSVTTSLDAYLDRMFAGQLRFADAIISRAQQKWSGTDEDRKDISASDRIWYRFAIAMGYAEAPKRGEKSWLNELLTLTTNIAETPKTDNRRKCQACRQTEPEFGTPFCPNCNAPINTFETFMAGFPVADSWLMALRGEERETVLREIDLRKEGFRGVPSIGAPAAPRGTGPAAASTPLTPQQKAAQTKAANAAKAANATSSSSESDVPAAGTTNLPGEE